MRAISVKPAGSWPGDAADSVVLATDDRHRRRMAMTGTRGLSFVLDLPEAVWLRHGDAVMLEDGRLVEVLAAPEPLLEIRCADPLHLARIAWHLGNRHLPSQIFPKYIRIRRDHVIAEMAKQLGAKVTEIEAPFDPEGGAYEGGGRQHAHAHGHDAHDHGHHGHGHHDHSHHHHGHGHHHHD